MDIRSFFQPKQAAPAAAAAAVDNSNSSKQPPVKKEDKQETPRKRKSPERLDVSASDFFSKSSNNENDHKKEASSSSSSKKKIKRQIVIESSDEDEDDDDDDDVVVMSTPTAVSKKMTAAATTTSTAASLSSKQHMTPVKTPRQKEDDEVEEIRMSPRRSTRKATPIIQKKSEASVPVKTKPKSSPATTTKKKPRILEQPTVRRTTPPSLYHTQCLQRDHVPLTFCFSGVLEQISRETAQDVVKSLGGRVTTAVSKKTDYLVVGNVLEDGRDYQQGSKYKKAVELGSVIVVQGEELFYGLLQTYHELCGPVVDAVGMEEPVVAVPVVSSNPYSTAAAATTTTKTNPYAKKASNPYASSSASAKTNPYGRKTTVAAAVTSTTTTTTVSVAMTPADPSSMLWVDKYKPKCAQEILGNQDAVKKLTQWLNGWERTFNTSKNSNKAFSAPNGPWKAALLSGPPGIGSKCILSVWSVDVFVVAELVT